MLLQKYVYYLVRLLSTRVTLDKFLFSMVECLFVCFKIRW
jgi:hypothetical protein